MQWWGEGEFFCRKIHTKNSLGPDWKLKKYIVTWFLMQRFFFFFCFLATYLIPQFMNISCSCPCYEIYVLFLQLEPIFSFPPYVYSSIRCLLAWCCDLIHFRLFIIYSYACSSLMALFFDLVSFSLFYNFSFLLLGLKCVFTD